MNYFNLTKVYAMAIGMCNIITKNDTNYKLKLKNKYNNNRELNETIELNHEIISCYTTRNYK